MNNQKCWFPLQNIIQVPELMEKYLKVYVKFWYVCFFFPLFFD